MFIDTHTHLYLEEFSADIDAVIQRSVGAGIDKLFLPNIDSSSINSLHALCKKYPANCFAMMGLHPCSVKENYSEELKIVHQNLTENKYYAVGEIGIDLYWDKTFLSQQIDAFEKQINWAVEFNLPIVIHCRDAFDEIYKTLTQFKKRPKAIFHCFGGTVEQAEKIIALENFKLGIGGVVTYKNSGLDKTLAHIDLQHMVLETDSPYLTPIPYRGKRNESSYIKIIAQKVAEVKNCSIEDVATITSNNARQIFGDTF